MNSRISFIALLAAVLLAVLLLTHQYLFFPLLHLRSLLLGMLPIISFFPAASILIRKISPDGELDPLERQIYSLFGSIFLSSLSAFLLITLRIGYPSVFAFLSLLLILLSWSWWKKRIIEWHSSFNRWTFQKYSRIEIVLLVLALLLGLAAAVLPPVGYDANEYHLPAPEQYLKSGAWRSFSENVYCAFPMNVEMLYLWPLSGRSPAGCKVINFFFACLTALSVWRLSHWWGINRESLLVPLIFLSTGMVHWLILQADIDLALSMSAAVLLLAYERYRVNPCRIDAVMMALSLGFAFGAKYIAALAIGFPFLVLLLVDARLLWRQKKVLPLFFVFLGAILLFSPWAIRNVLLYGNPFYPLLTGTLGGKPEFFSDLFHKAHAPSFISLTQTVSDFFILPLKNCLADSIPNGYSCLWLLGVPALFMTVRCHPLRRSLAFMASAYLAWFFLTQRNDRFLSSLLPLMTLWGAYSVLCISEQSLRRIGRILILPISAIQLYGVTAMVIRPETVEYLFLPTLEQNYMSQRMPHYRAIEWLNREWEKPRTKIGKVLFVGEAQSYGVLFPSIVPTVFNHHPLETGLDRTVTHILYNRSELKRLRDGYGPLGWPLGEFLFRWIEENKDRLKPVFDAYPEKPGIVVVYEVIW